ncbi:unnamed protein product [Rotaria socialis]|uniref:HEAT repeat domain-containing protein n=2 Tax=Rotaria socialis TaxID=392032 RepID=A0A818VPL5_9BILA|nr:unnamed protein product [Rotaria socialis]
MTINSCNKIQNLPEVQNELASLLKTEAVENKSNILNFIGKLNITDPHNELVESLFLQLETNDAKIRATVCYPLAKIGKKAATSQVIDGFVVALGDQDDEVRWSACSALEKMGEKAATSQVIDRLVVALGGLVEGIRSTDLKGASTLLKLFSYAQQWRADADVREAEGMVKSNVYDGIDGMSRKLFQLLIHTRDWRWLPIFVECCLMEEIVVMVIGDKVIMHFERVAVETRIRNLELLSELCKAFDDFGLKVLGCRPQNSRVPCREREWCVLG